MTSRLLALKSNVIGRLSEKFPQNTFSLRAFERPDEEGTVTEVLEISCGSPTPKQVTEFVSELQDSLENNQVLLIKPKRKSKK